MSATKQPDTSHWGKAIIFALVFLLIFFVLFSRSSCARSLEAAKNAATSTETTAADSEGAEQENGEASSESPSGEGSEKEPENTEEAEDKTKTKPEEATSKDELKPAPEEASEKAEESKTETPANTTPQEEGAPASAGTGESTGQSIGGLSVRGERLGVILDVSGSMRRYLDSLRKEIRAGFADAEFREVEGCLLEPIDPSATLDPSTASRDSVMDAIAELAREHQVDAIYWFCDLQDERTQEAVQQLSAIALGRTRLSIGFRLYIRSTDELPDAALDEIVRRSGGAFERSR